jgi:hypothetical protein
MDREVEPLAVDERRRAELYDRMSATLGPEATATMFDLLPPAGERGATADDVDAVALRIDRLSDRIDARIDHVSDRIDHVSGRVDELSDRMDRRFDELDVRFDALRYELLAAFRGELVTAVSGQTRAVILAVATATFGIGGLAVTLAQLL